jgi:hypothetical protein
VRCAGNSTSGAADAVASDALLGKNQQGSPIHGVLVIEKSHSMPKQGGTQVFPLSGAAVFDAKDTQVADHELAALQTPIMVLDEIDAGVGPRLGSSIGRMLHGMASGGQTLCVSHLPQVRCMCRATATQAPIAPT